MLKSTIISVSPRVVSTMLNNFEGQGSNLTNDPKEKIKHKKHYEFNFNEPKMVHPSPSTRLVCTRLDWFGPHGDEGYALNRIRGWFPIQKWLN